MIKQLNPLFACQDGQTGVYDSHAWPRGKERPEAFIKRTLHLMSTLAVEQFTGVSVYQEPSRWEFAYLSDGNHTLRNLGYDRWAAGRRPWVGASILMVNFCELSHVMRAVTRDPALVREFQRLIAINPSAERCAEYHAKVAEDLGRRRAAYERLHPEAASHA